MEVLQGENRIRKKVFLMISIIILLSLFFYVQNNYLAISQYMVKHRKIPSALDGYKIVQVSDLHNKRFGAHQKKLLHKIQKCKPNLIVVTGDLVDSNKTDFSVALEFIQGAVKLAPVYYVTGNHEVWLGNKGIEMVEQLKSVGVHCLHNRYVEISANGASFVLLGLHENNLHDSTLQYMMQEISSEKFSVLLAHEPQFMEQYANNRVDLVLSGHAHGGQFRIPFIGGIVAPDQGIFPKYTEGMHKERDTTMIISRGLGNSIIPFRVWNYPEIVCVELKNSPV